MRIRRLRAPLAMAGWVVVTYGFRLGTAIAQRTWDSVAASMVLLGFSAAVVVATVGRRHGSVAGWERPVVRAFACLAAAWSVFRLVTTWAGDHTAAFVAVHTVIAGVLLVLAVLSWRSTARPDSAGPGSGGPSGQDAAQRVPSAGGVPSSR